jgi:hypothetical protein
MGDSGDTVDCSNKFPPAVTLSGQNFSTGGGQAIISTAPLSGFFDPPALDPAAVFQSVEQGIKGRDIEPEDAARAQFDQLPDVITMAGPIFDQGKNQKFGATFFQFAIERS